ncbi:SCO6745 family protein [Actinomadura roseirufa]|uniref:SCO6745 family protein n=1 Tax=Actinomadura roseirufa TaxID=2094049 RepID=UPI001040F91E|nr:hypothetical protein [Actinomadura roseirufa]
MDASIARKMWMVLEPLHAVTYFSPECVAANKEVGLKGFWMGYFGSRGAPLGPVPAAVVEATFHGFPAERVRRAVPDAWGFASPEAILRVRAPAAAAALRRAAPGIADAAPDAVRALRAVVEAAEAAGRPLFAANRDLGVPDEPVQALWQLATALREHRGDGHVALLTGAGLSGVQANVLAVAAGHVTLEWIRLARGWSQEKWDEAEGELARRGLVEDGRVTEAGRELRAGIERRTDALAAPPYGALDDPAGLHAALAPFARALAASGDVPFPNPIGLPRLD